MSKVDILLKHLCDSQVEEFLDAFRKMMKKYQVEIKKLYGVEGEYEAVLAAQINYVILGSYPPRGGSPLGFSKEELKEVMEPILAEIKKLSYVKRIDYKVGKLDSGVQDHDIVIVFKSGSWTKPEINKFYLETNEYSNFHKF